MSGNSSDRRKCPRRSAHISKQVSKYRVRMFRRMEPYLKKISEYYVSSGIDSCLVDMLVEQEESKKAMIQAHHIDTSKFEWNFIQDGIKGGTHE